MSVGVRLGNLTLNELAGRLGIELSEEHKAFLTSTRVDKVSDSLDKNYKIPANTWHAFDLPRTQVHAGSKKMAKKMMDILREYMVDGSFPGEVSRLVFTFDLLEEEKFGYAERKQVEEGGHEVYYGYNDEAYSKVIRYFVKTRETEAGNVFFQEVRAKFDGNYGWEEGALAVPNVDEKEQERVYDRKTRTFSDEKVDKKEVRKKKQENDSYVIKEHNNNVKLTRWDGNPNPANLKRQKF